MCFTITPRLSSDQRSALEHLFFFNANQHRVLPGIQHCIASYGVPVIGESDDGLEIRIGDLAGVKTLFAVSELGSPLGAAVFVQLPTRRFVLLHLVVGPLLRSSLDINLPVLLELMREIRSAARRADGVDRLEIGYNALRSVRLSTGNARA